MMNSGFSNFKLLGADCEVYVRRLTLQHTDHRLISNIRKITKASGGFVVELDCEFQLHTLVEMDVKFPGQPHYYRSRGLVEWHVESGNPNKPFKHGIRVITMEKLDPGGCPMEKPKQRKPALTARVSKHVELGDYEVAEAAPTPREPVVAPRKEEKKEVRRHTELKIPAPDDVSLLLTNLIGDKVDVSKAHLVLGIDDIAVVGSYRGEDGRTLSLIGADIALAVRLGAALAMVPRDVAENDIKARNIQEETKQNTQEIFNISTSVLNAPGIPHHRFTKLYNCFQDEHPEDIRSIMNDPVARVDFVVDVPGYGSGRMCYLFAEWHRDNEGAAASKRSVSGSLDSPSPVPPSAESKADSSSAVPFDAPTAEGGIDLAKTQFAAPESLEGEKPAGSSFPITPPTAREVADLFTNLVGDAVSAEPSKGALLDRDAFAVIGNFVTDGNRTVALCALDIHLANWAAAALAMIPKDVVKLDIESKRLSDECRDNVQEILNIAASVLNKPGMPHLRFSRLIVTMESDPPDDYSAVIDAPTERRDFKVKIPGYGEGVMVCLLKSWP